MTQDLYRKEAIEHRSRRLFGEIILKSGPSLWWITALLVLTVGLGVFGLFGISIETDAGRLSLLQWLLGESA